MKRIAIAVILFLGYITGFAQANNDSCTMEISLLTCAPGSDLYSIFGHTAIRVRDARRGMDIVYNYGTFDDTDPLFYVHFTKGIMNYSLSAETYDSFMMEYEYEHRPVMGQVLNLTAQKKSALRSPEKIHWTKTVFINIIFIPIIAPRGRPGSLNPIRRIHSGMKIFCRSRVPVIGI
jgi:hypothetical protein